MKNQLFHSSRLLLFLVVVLFSLTPCKAKASLFETFGGTFEQPLNQSKVTSNCTSSCFISEKTVNSKTSAEIIPTDFKFKNCFKFEKKRVQTTLFLKPIVLKFPPKYILYKQFKFDVVYASNHGF